MAAPTPDLALAKKIQKLRSRGKTYRQIAEMLGKQVSSVHRSNKYNTATLSPVRG